MQFRYIRMTNTTNSSSHAGHLHAAAFDMGCLPADEIHTLHYQQYGNPAGRPVIFLHGGPGGEGCTIADTIFFSPKIYRVVFLDQRGAGKSTPTAELRNNTSHHLVSDIELLRMHLSIRKWHMVFGGSWGSTLALLYAQMHPEVVGSLVLRGIFLVRQAELDWNYRDGASRVFREVHKAFREYIPESERGDILTAYYRRLTSHDERIRQEAGRNWSRLEMAAYALLPDSVESQMVERDQGDPKWAETCGRIEAHYFMNGAWLEEGQLLKKENIDRIRHIPSELVGLVLVFSGELCAQSL